jgi:predicted AAA+ superfamily ATPase
MFKRLLLAELEKWAVQSDRKPLIIRVARQVGKTTLVNQFAARFKHYIYLNLELPQDRQPFEKFSFICLWIWHHTQWRSGIMPVN